MPVTVVLDARMAASSDSHSTASGPNIFKYFNPKKQVPCQYSSSCLYHKRPLGSYFLNPLHICKKIVLRFVPATVPLGDLAHVGGLLGLRELGGDEGTPCTSKKQTPGCSQVRESLNPKASDARCTLKPCL